jgi:hypothetical protein
MSDYNFDEHGRPLWPDHPWNQPEPPRDPTAERLELLRRAFRQGVKLAAVEAMLVCQRRGVSWPAWLQDEGLNIILAVLVGDDKRRGRNGNWLSEYRADFVHFVRWDTVEEVRERQKIALPDDDLGKTWDECYSAASKLLRGTFAAGTSETIKRSRKIVARDDTLRFVYLYRTIRLLGLDKLDKR